MKIIPRQDLTIRVENNLTGEVVVYETMKDEVNVLFCGAIGSEMWDIKCCTGAFFANYLTKLYDEHPIFVKRIMAVKLFDLDPFVRETKKED